MEKLSLLLRNRAFWAAVVGLIFVLLRGVFPFNVVSEDQATEVIFVLASFIAAEAIEAAAGRPVDLGSIFGSRKFWAALVGITFVLLKAVYPHIGIDEAQIEQLVWLIVSYVLGVGVADVGLALSARAGRHAGA